MMGEVLICLSGGPDSLVLAERARRSGRLRGAVHFYYHHPAMKQERAAAVDYCDRTGVELWIVGLPGLQAAALSADGPRVVPGRNLVFVSSAVNLAASIGATEVQIGANQADARDYPDCRASWISSVDALSAPFGVRVTAPLLDVSKAAILAEAGGVDVLTAAVSCYQPGADGPCMTCDSCAERCGGGS